ncbi:MAG TPA: sugar ABC transporter ATP-binding protein [Capillimicrobium sp.]|nr:sugar ABC transporter ATP-binding protein [Capillimicrobium sp.]
MPQDSPIAGAGASRPRVEAHELSKRFGGVHAVKGVSVAIAAGSVHGLVGENGAGKSTLSKMIGGVHAPDGGELRVDGRPVRFASPRDALAEGIAMIAQEIALVPARTVLENVFLGLEPRRLGVVRRRALRARFAELDARTGFGIPADARVADLRTADQQKVEILRAIARDARVILMDEPTAALTIDESRRLLEIIRRLAADGTSVVLVSHHLEEVLEVCDTVTVMRDGALVRTGPAAAETPDTLVQAMLGRDLELMAPAHRRPKDDAPVVLEARGLRREGALDDVSLQLRAGEVVGLAGLVGSGRTEVARALFGADRLDAGEVLVGGRALRLRHPRDAIRHGIAMLPESRKDEGLLMLRSVRENAALTTVGQLARAGIVRRRAERAQARALTERVDVRAASIEQPVVSLSGGNQQKVLFAKWLARRPAVLLADEPTRGVDIGAKRQIHDLLLELAGDGMAVLLISSEIEEVLSLSHRVLVMRAGRIVEEIPGDVATEENVMRAAFAPARTSPGAPST